MENEEMKSELLKLPKAIEENEKSLYDISCKHEELVLKKKMLRN